MVLRHNKLSILIFIVSIILSVLVILIGLTSQESYTFLSKADTGVREKAVAMMSQEVLNVENDLLPSCVLRMRYLPSNSNSERICFSQFSCIDGLSEPSQLDQCTTKDGQVTCDTSQLCLSSREWILKAQEVCGC